MCLNSPWCKASLGTSLCVTRHMHLSALIQEKKRKEKTTPFGVNLTRSQVLYQAAWNPHTSFTVRSPVIAAQKAGVSLARQRLLCPV